MRGAVPAPNALNVAVAPALTGLCVRGGGDSACALVPYGARIGCGGGGLTGRDPSAAPDAHAPHGGAGGTSGGIGGGRKGGTRRPDGGGDTRADAGPSC